MQLKHKQGNTKGMRVLFNKPPKWNEGNALTLFLKLMIFLRCVGICVKF